ncbi:S-methyl-5-thioribose-1-phosphate isomerase [Candidatus Bathyarchaeota archaeon]|nr:S-methyl-5-thioribose-1-phosphate isomerase [Candidatus Bathyarchaeota archaeon]
MERVIEAAERIRRLEVQGATGVALTALRAIVEQIEISKAQDRASALRELDEASRILFSARETEPFMRNAIRFLRSRVEEAEWKNIEELRPLIRKTSQELLETFKDARRRIAEVGSRRILNGDMILTHCHSSTVMMILKRAKERGIDFQVVLTETRPLYQGRRTARELSEAGIGATMIVDSAVRSFMRGISKVLVGADAITSEGNVINKVGTSLIALAAQEARVPFYVASELLKFDPQTIHGDYEAIEERSPQEVWANPPEGLMIRNPAFDVTRRDYIHGLICEDGVISPHIILEAVLRRYPWILKGVQV